mgnify:CR=1 FL=1
MPHLMPRISWFLSSAIVLFGDSIVALENRGRLTVEIDGLRNQTGEVCLRVYDRSAGFPGEDEGVVAEQCSNIATVPLTLEFDSLAFGTYAIALFHDENIDAVLNTNFVGIPLEGFGFSNNPTLRSGPPEFQEAVVFVGGRNTTVQIEMQYLF